MQPDNHNAQKIKILLVEDLPADAEMAVRAIRSENIDFEFRITDNESDFRQALQEFDPDLVISDYSMPAFNGMRALEITRKADKYYPFIVLTGSMNEETAVACMKAGANDYVIKEQIKRLPFAVKEEIARNADRQERIRFEKQLRESEEKFRKLFQDHSAIKFIIDPTDSRIVEANQAAADFYGWSVEQLQQMKISDINLIPRTDLLEKMHDVLSNKNVHYEFLHRKADGSINDVEIFASAIHISGKTYLHSIIHDISEKKQAEEKNKLLSRSIEQSPVSIVITDKSGFIEYVNPAFLDLTGYSPGEALGQNPKILNSGHHDKEFFTGMWQTILNGKDWHGEILNRKKNGELFWEDMIISPILNPEQQITHFIAVKEDITGKKKMIEDLVEAKKRAEESDQLKSAFLANMSHEIRTPMNGILGFAELLKEPDLTMEEIQQYVAIIESSGKRMLDTLNSIIEISKIETGQVQIQRTRIDLQQEINEALRFFELEASKKGLTLQAGESDESRVFTCDRYKLQSVLSNLVKNAIKYTQRGQIEIGHQVRDSDLHIYVKDTGMGIPAEKLTSIFNRFEQADISLTRQFEGSGLGLAISKAYVEMLGGRIWVDSEPQKGSTFWFSLPLE